MSREYGVPLVISTDTHVTAQFDFMTYGVSVARRGWIEKRDVLNALGYDELMARLTARKAGRTKGRR